MSDLRTAAERIIEDFDLDYGNAETSIQDGYLYMTVEAPNHATVSVDVDGTADEERLRRFLATAMDDFDPDEEFDKLWSSDFAELNGFTPSGFIGMLQEDKDFFDRASDALRSISARSGDEETLCEIRWTVADLRAWLNDHEYPDTPANMEAMKAMVSGKDLKDRSIEMGWEAIDAMVDAANLDRADDDAEERADSYDPTDLAAPATINAADDAARTL
ncbi:hypothetical protein BLEM_2078 [Bifidobacterium lemurum]|uniref:Uncharacterized protein n=1 Tax=Bifidobacterium lemurum TaxID=1603886 RepID=A0A261FLQ9_9BIFI|nr:hypothetical protein [Bifidobacterium lemurum]OZG59903.1 hypothetical protein BLEM_2078 [Bifidobacterium lemurum]QOL33929.1 hypothetical protein BL8807_09215 [Bifidobacterium lemurum]